LEQYSKNKTDSIETIVIIGAGITGLATAWRLSKEGYKIIVLERQNFPGGLAASISDQGFKMDIGPHFLTLPKNSSITDLIKELIGNENLIEIKKIHEAYRVYFRGKLLTKYPSIYDIIFKSGILNFVHSLLDYFMIKIMPKESKNIESSIEDYLISIYGKFLYNTWFKPYIIQNEGIGDPQMPKELIEKMFPPPSIKKIINYILKNSSKKPIQQSNDDINTEFFDCYFRYGMGSIIENMVKDIKKNEGEIILGVNIEKISHHENLKKIEFFKNDKKHEINTDKIIYSTPPPISLRWFKDIPKKINIKSKKLEAFNSIIVFLMINTPKVFDGWVISVYDPDLVFFRITQQNFLSNDIAPPKKSLLCVEIKCTEHEDIWKMKESEIFSNIKNDLNKIKNLDTKKIYNYKILKLNRIYPIAQKTANINNDEIIKFINSFKNEYAVSTSTIDSGRLISESKQESDTNNTPRLGGIYEALYNSEILTSRILNSNK